MISDCGLIPVVIAFLVASLLLVTFPLLVAPPFLVAPPLLISSHYPTFRQ